jgi:hypothetical protein
MKFTFNDGGRKSAGYTGNTSDCVTRAIAIATQKPYQEVYDALNQFAVTERRGKRKRGISNARNGVYRTTYQKYLQSIGWEFTATMGIGTGCKFHLRDGELPMGRLICSCSKHLVAVIDGVIHDTHDPSRNGNRAVYGYYVKKSN